MSTLLDSTMTIDMRIAVLCLCTTRYAADHTRPRLAISVLGVAKLPVVITGRQTPCTHILADDKNKVGMMKTKYASQGTTKG